MRTPSSALPSPPQGAVLIVGAGAWPLAAGLRTSRATGFLVAFLAAAFFAGAFLAGAFFAAGFFAAAPRTVFLTTLAVLPVFFLAAVFDVLRAISCSPQLFVQR